MRNCKKCGKFTTQAICIACQDRARLEKRNQRQAAQLMVYEDKIQGLEQRITTMKRYQVHTNTVWNDMAWDQALKKVDWLRNLGVTYVYITDERGVKIREWGEKENLLLQR